MIEKYKIRKQQAFKIPLKRGNLESGASIDKNHRPKISASRN